LQVARAFGAMFIISVDSQDKPLDVATQLGTDAVLNDHRLKGRWVSEVKTESHS